MGNVSLANCVMGGLSCVEMAKKAATKFTWMRSGARPRPVVVDWQRIQTVRAVLASVDCLAGLAKIGLWHNKLQRF
jgi:hypothetical protein